MISNGTIMVWPTENIIKKLKHKATVRSCQYIDTEIYYLTGSVMVHFLEGSALLKLWNVTSDDSYHLGQCTNVLTKQFHPRNIIFNLIIQEALFGVYVLTDICQAIN